jgi:hypothetical protein
MLLFLDGVDVAVLPPEAAELVGEIPEAGAGDDGGSVTDCAGGAVGVADALMVGEWFGFGFHVWFG